jgi:hypothetical protein
MDIFMDSVSHAFNHYRIIMAMDRAAWHTDKKQADRMSRPKIS